MPEVMEELQKPVCAIAEYDPIAAALATLSEKYGKAVFDVSTKVGLESAKAARAELRGYRTNLEATRKNIKNPALERCRLIDAEAKDITGKLEALEKPIAAQIEAEETRKEQEKQTKLQAEIARVTALRSRISAFTELVDTIEPKADACQKAIVRMKAIPIDDTFEELQPDAQQAKDAALFRLQNLFAQHTASEDEAEQVRIDRAKLVQLEAESVARRAEDDRKAAEERARLASEQEAKLVEERRRIAQVAQAEREAAERKARETHATQQAEQRRLDVIAAELRHKQEIAAEEERKRQQMAAFTAAMHKDIEDALEAIDAALFSGDTFMQYAERMKLREYLGRWDRWDKEHNYFAADGTLLNANGTRSIFDDVDQ